MPVKLYITDPSTGKQVSIDIAANEANALLVATREQKIFENKIAFFTNPDYGIAMNQAAVPTGIPEHVHNGNDNSYWTGSAIVGTKTTFSSTDRPHTGTRSVKTDAAAVDDIYQFARATDLSVADYISLTIWINVDVDWAAGDSVEIYGWDTSTGMQVGTAVALENYFAYYLFDTWHKISIPLSDMGLVDGTIDALRIQQATKQVKSPVYYLDDIQFEEDPGTAGQGQPITYKVEPDKGTWLHIASIHVFLADNDYDSDNADGSVPAIPYDAWLGVAALDAGVHYERIQGGKVRQSLIMKQLSDLLALPQAVIDSYGSAADGTDTWISVSTTFSAQVILKPENGDKMQFTVSDDLSGLDLLNISAHGKVEYRCTNGEYMPPSLSL